MRELGLARPDGEMLVAEAEIEIRRPERVLIRGQSGSGKSTIMRAVAGVWPWGRGAIHLPKGAITFMPQKPYFPVGTLRDAMLYPKVPEGITDDVLKDMLHKVGLDHLRDRLDETERWDHILSGGEQQRVAFARVLVHKPEWIFMDEATSALDETGQENVMKLLIEELPETSIVSIGHRPGLEVFHTRELTLVPGEEGARLKPEAETPQRALQRRLPRDVGAPAAATRASPASGRPSAPTSEPTCSGGSGRMRAGMRRRTFVALGCASAMSRTATAQAPWPSRPVHIICGFSVGTTTDLLARLLADRLGERLQRPVVVENRPGAGGTIAANLVAHAPADGYTLMLGSAALTLAPRLFSNVTFKPLKDFEPVGMVGSTPNVVLATPAVSIASIADLIDQARQAPGRLRYASSGPGSGSWIGMKLLEVRARSSWRKFPTPRPRRPPPMRWAVRSTCIARASPGRCRWCGRADCARSA